MEITTNPGGLILNNVKEVPKAVDAAGKAAVGTAVAIYRATAPQGYTTKIESIHKPDAKKLTEDTPFSTALKIFKIGTLKPDKKKGGEDKKIQRDVKGELAAYCVGFVVSINFYLEGHIAYTIGIGLQRGDVMISGDIDAIIRLGVAAEIEASHKFTKPIITAPIPVAGLPLGVPNLFTIGPAFTVKALAELKVKLEGNALLGTKAGITDFKAELDFVKNSGKFVRSTPYYHPYFQGYDVAVTAFASVGLAIGLAFGIEIPTLNGYSNSLAITEKPALKVSAVYSESTLFHCKPDSCAHGIKYGLDCK